MDVGLTRNVLARIAVIAAMTVCVSVTGAWAQSDVDRKKADQVRPVEPSAPTPSMNAPELPKKPDNSQNSKAPPGTPQPPEQPYPATTKKE